MFECFVNMYIAIQNEYYFSPLFTLVSITTFLFTLFLFTLREHVYWLLNSVIVPVSTHHHNHTQPHSATRFHVIPALSLNQTMPRLNSTPTNPVVISTQVDSVPSTPCSTLPSTLWCIPITVWLHWDPVTGSTCGGRNIWHSCKWFVFVCNFHSTFFNIFPLTSSYWLFHYFISFLFTSDIYLIEWIDFDDHY